MPHRTLRVVLLIAFAALGERPAAGQSTRAHVSVDTAGRVVATISTLQGTVRLVGVIVELQAAPNGLVVARTATDGAGQVTFPDVPPGRYVVKTGGAGFETRASAVFEVRPGEATAVLLDLPLTFLLPEVVVRAERPSPTDSVQPVSLSDLIGGAVLDVAPLEGDDFHSLLPLLPGVVRGPDGRLRIKGGQPTQGALQVSSASLIDPSTGDFDLELPGPSIESVEVLANPFAAEYGRFSTSVTQIRTRPGTNVWEVKPGNLVPRLGRRLTRLRAFEPRLALRGPLRRDRLFLAQDLQFRYVATPVKSLPGEPEVGMKSFDSFTRFDAVVSPRHTLGGGLIAFPREVRHATLSTWRPPDVTPELHQSGWAVGAVSRLALASDVVLETTVAGRWFEINVNSDEREGAMVYAPAGQQGAFFNDQEREVASLQWVEALSLARRWRGQHVVKLGADLQRSSFRGFSLSRPVEIRRTDGTLAERIVFGDRTTQRASGLEVAAFVQDRWRVTSRLTFELGLRLDDALRERVSWSPRAGMAVAVAPEGRAILRGGFGKFVQRTPLTVRAFPAFEGRTITRFAPDGRSPLGPPVTLVNVVDLDLRTPEAFVTNVEWNQRFGRRVLLKAAALHRSGTHDFLLLPDPAQGVLHLASAGRSRYREVEATVRCLGGERRDLTASYVWSAGTADLNSFDQFYGNFRTPIVRANANGPIATDVPHRLLVRGVMGLPGGWDAAPIFEWRSGFPWSAVDEYLDVVGPRNRTGRLPTVRTLDVAITRPWRVKKYRFRAGVRLYNLFGAAAARDVQANLTAPDYGRFFNPIERSIAFVLDLGR